MSPSRPFRGQQEIRQRLERQVVRALLEDRAQVDDRVDVRARGG